MTLAEDLARIERKTISPPLTDGYRADVKALVDLVRELMEDYGDETDFDRRWSEAKRKAGAR